MESEGHLAQAEKGMKGQAFMLWRSRASGAWACGEYCLEKFAFNGRWGSCCERNKPYLRRGCAAGSYWAGKGIWSLVSDSFWWSAGRSWNSPSVQRSKKWSVTAWRFCWSSWHLPLIWLSWTSFLRESLHFSV